MFEGVEIVLNFLDLEFEGGYGSLSGDFFRVFLLGGPEGRELFPGGCGFCWSVDVGLDSCWIGESWS